MSDDTALPDSNDPFTILGVSRDADEDALKRAYVAKIKIFRPDRSPDEFQRVRRAYEEALQWLKWERSSETEFEIHDETKESEPFFPDQNYESESDFDRNHAYPTWDSSIWPLAKDRRYDEAESKLQRAVKSNPADPGPYIQHFLLSELMGDDFDSVAEHLLKGIEAEANIGRWIVQILSSSELNTLASDERLGWDKLQNLQTGSIYSEVTNAKITAILLSGDWEPLLREVQSDAFVQEAHQDERVRYSGIRVALAAALRYPKESDEIYDLLAMEDYSGMWQEEVYLMRRRLRKTWKKWINAYPDADVLIRYVELAPVMDAEDLANLDLSTALENDPETYLQSMDGLRKKANSLYTHFLETLSYDGKEAEDGDSPINNESLEKFAEEGEEKLDATTGETCDSYIVFTFLVITIAAFWNFGWWGAVPLSLLLLYFCISVTLVDNRTYKKHLRSDILGLLIEHRCYVRDIMSAMKGYKSISNINRLADELEEDQSMHIYSHMLHYRDADPDYDIDYE